MCGTNAICSVVNHSPICQCPPGYTGSPFSACHEIIPERVQVPTDPCNPSPCGPFSRCRNNNGYAICTCEAGYIGSPPSCRPECTVDSDCSFTKQCRNNKCQEACLNSPCGSNAYCKARNHSPTCVCNDGYEGDPFSACRLRQQPKQGTSC